VSLLRQKARFKPQITQIAQIFIPAPSMGSLTVITVLAELQFVGPWWFYDRVIKE
jgi:hypothetical protein